MQQDYIKQLKESTIMVSLRQFVSQIFRGQHGFVVFKQVSFFQVFALDRGLDVADLFEGLETTFEGTSVVVFDFCDLN
jgi:hypothetical protein